MILDEEDYLAHYGILRKSGRYPWGSGQNPLQRSKTFLDILEEHKKEEMTESEIAKAYSRPPDYPFTVSDLRALKSRTTAIQTRDRIMTAQKLKDKGMSTSAIGRQMGLNESTVRSLLEPGRLERLDILQSTANMLKREVDEKGFIDVGAQVHRDLPIDADNSAARVGISPDKFNTALSLLKEEGYQVHSLYMPQAGTGEMTRYKVLAKPGVTRKEVFANRENIRLISEKSEDRGRTYGKLGIQDPLNIPLSRVAVRYKEEGGADADGVIYVRPGVSDVSLGKSQYAQVRIAIDGSHYLKGMAVYKDDLPPGVDLMFNTNKSNTGNKLDAMKPLKTLKETGEVDKDNPFGAVIKIDGQILGKDGKVSSAMNLVNEEGDWDTWSRNLSRQVLSKQSPDLAERQLALSFAQRRTELDDINSLTNPIIRQTLLKTFSDETDSAAVHLKAAAMPNQATKVLLPSNKVKPTEIFAPTFDDGDRVALIRFPHAGTFEIPELTVNNRNRDAKTLAGLHRGGTARDLVVINPKVAQQLSGADFDGDTVVVIPNRRGDIARKRPLDELKGFDPQIYKVPLGPKTKKHPEGTPIIEDARKQNEMGNVTNLISDMTIRGANDAELARAVKHSMVVIDSEKHNLDYKKSYVDQGIKQLKVRYQGVNAKGQPRGASTLITRATAQTRVPYRKERLAKEGGPIDPVTGKKVYVKTGEHSVRYRGLDGKTVSKSFRSKEEAEQFVRDQAPNGKITERKFKSKQLAEVEDAYKLVSDPSGTPIERVYADHSNRLKAMANEARRDLVRTEPTPYSPSAAKIYKKEVDSLNAKLNTALKNAPLERQAQVVANKTVAQKKKANPDMDGAEEKKIKGQALTEARLRTGAAKARIGAKGQEITPKEWEAIQAGAISPTKLREILKNSDVDAIRNLARPRQNPVMTDVTTARAKAMLSGGATLSEVARALGVPLSTLKSGIE